jgi:hypothetical protein
MVKLGGVGRRPAKERGSSDKRDIDCLMHMQLMQGLVHLAIKKQRG